MADVLRLEGLEKSIEDYDFLNRDLQIGFDYNLSAVLKPVKGRPDFDIVQMEWGFIPDRWFGKPLDTRDKVFAFRNGYKDASGKFIPGITTLNAMAEELVQPGKIYKESALSRRCLVLASGFFEWRHVHRINKRTGQPNKTSDKYPYYICLKDKPYFFMAGIWKPWTDVNTGEYVETFAVVTTAANKLMEQVHNSKKRMPTILKDELAYEWMFGNLDEKRVKEIACTQLPAEEMEACPIAKDFREVLEPAKPFAYEDLPALAV